ncbi:thioesterase family protein [Aeromicrobium sp. CF4.19]|uniref:thioesterase family protein n=1 Tax=Aeromicrobium sp. CF4.19 TaxID=3373082 RepID=UPI003EE5B6B3
MDEPASASIRHVVTEADTAAALGSGDLAVLGTPRLLAWCEEATCAALELPQGRTSVGTRVEVEHLLPSPVGATISARAELVRSDGRMVTFRVVALDQHEAVVGTGEIRRVVVDRARFLDRLRPVED